MLCNRAWDPAEKQSSNLAMCNMRVHPSTNTRRRTEGGDLTALVCEGASSTTHSSDTGCCCDESG